MRTEREERELLSLGNAEPTKEHDQAVLEAIDSAGRRISNRRRKRRDVRWIAIPAAIAASLLVIPYLLYEPSGPERSAAEEAPVEPANAAELSEAPRRLRWRAEADAVRYQIYLRNMDGDIVFSGETRHPVSQIELPESTMARLMADETYVWTVSIEGALRSELGPYWFSVSPATE